MSEVSSLNWRDIRPNPRGGVQVTIFGKGGKTRIVPVPAGNVYGKLLHQASYNPKTHEYDYILNESLPNHPHWKTLGYQASDPIFRSRKGGHLTTTQIRRIIKDAAERAGIQTDFSPHWLRHAHATHSLDHGAPIHYVQSTLGHASIDTTSKYLHVSGGKGSSEYLDLDL